MIKVQNESFFGDAIIRKRQRRTASGPTRNIGPVKAETKRGAKPVKKFRLPLKTLLRAATYGSAYALYGKQGLIAAVTADAVVSTFAKLSQWSAGKGPLRNAFRDAGKVCRRVVYAGIAGGMVFTGATYGLPAAKDVIYTHMYGQPFLSSFEGQIASAMMQSKGKMGLGETMLLTADQDKAECENLTLKELPFGTGYKLTCEMPEGYRLVSRTIPQDALTVDKTGRWVMTNDADHFRSVYKNKYGTVAGFTGAIPNPAGSAAELSQQLKQEAKDKKKAGKKGWGQVYGLSS